MATMTGLATGTANSITSARTVWPREEPKNLWCYPEFTRLFQNNQKEDQM